MFKLRSVCVLSLLSLALSATAFAQDDAKPSGTAKMQEAAKPAPPDHYYRLDFQIQEIGADGKAINSRDFNTILATGNSARDGQIRSGTRIPVATGAYSEDKSEKQVMQFQDVDLGVRIDTRQAAEVGRQLTFTLFVDVSDLVPERSVATPSRPIIRHYSWDSRVLIPIGKPTVVFASDALDSKGGLQVVVTATLLP